MIRKHFQIILLQDLLGRVLVKNKKTKKNMIDTFFLGLDQNEFTTGIQILTVKMDWIMAPYRTNS